jgi:hypothetical protein
MILPEIKNLLREPDRRRVFVENDLLPSRKTRGR